MRKLIMILSLVLITTTFVAFASSKRAQFIAGGALVNIGFFLQDRLHDYDFHESKTDSHDLSAQQVWDEFEKQNTMASSIRGFFPRSAEHPLIAMVTCMDARLDSAELAGDTRRYYYILRNAGSTLLPEQEDMLELAVRNGVKVLVFTRHTDCAAEKAAADPTVRKLYPNMISALDKRDQQLADFLARPYIAQQIKAGKLLVKNLLIDTSTNRLITTQR